MKIKDNIQKIKQTVDWFPGVVLGLGRQCGKTSAILEMVHEDCGGDAFVISPTSQMSDMAKHRYGSLSGKPKFISNPLEARGSNWAIYVDEWWMLSEKSQHEVEGMLDRVICRLGSAR